MTKPAIWLLAAALSACGATASPKPEPTLSEADLAVGEDVQPEAFEVVSEPAEWPSGSLVLKGTLVRPGGAGARPGVVLVGDWGIRGRDGVVGEVFGVRLPTEVAVYRSLAEGLAARGIAVLIYDKRNCTVGTDPWCSYPVEYATANPALGSALVDDAQAAARWLRARPDVSSVSFIGHGHGAEVALVAATGSGAQNVVLLQPPASSLGERARFQVEESIRQIDARIATAGDTPESDILRTRKRELETLLPSPNLLGVAPPTAADLDALHAKFLAAAKEAKPPRLVLLGGTDPGEPPADGARLRELFEEELVFIAELSRVMVSLAQGDDPTVVSPVVLTHVSAFLNADLSK